MLELSVDIERLTWWIYIGKINQTESSEVKAELFYHIPIDTPISGIVPISESAIAAQIEQTKIGALAAGSLVEV